MTTTTARYAAHGRVLIAGSLAAAVGLAAVQVVPRTIIMAWFVRPAAHVAALYLGLPSLDLPDGSCLIPHPQLNLAVIQECSGFTFYVILCTFLVYLAVRHGTSWRAALGSLAIPLACYPFTVVLNAIRLIACLYAHIYMPAAAPPAVSGSAHLWIGILVFVPALVFAHFLLQRRFDHDR